MKLISINAGLPKPYSYRGKTIVSAIDKTPLFGPAFVDENGLREDRQAEQTLNGGFDKALHAYCLEHYPFWEGRLDRQLAYGAFGENLTVESGLENEAYIGDVYSLGTAMLQISEPRQPCYKLSVRFGETKLPLWFREQRFIGYYFRVLESGIIEAGQSFKLEQRETSCISVLHAYEASFDREEGWPERAAAVLQSSALGRDWREALQNRLKGFAPANGN
ncbi:MOSC domain-containing protein [Paenibacillus sp. GCM10027627]|uniref:MOSC domain-containing protein n=1 Tax=unclassified Paenibacillus TaxID=185978 RepID=UPI003627A63E